MKISRIFGLCVGIILLSAWIAPLSLLAQDKPITLRYATMFPVSHKHAVLSAGWCEEVEKRNKR